MSTATHSDHDPAALAALLDALEEADNPDWLTALVLAGIDAGHDLAGAVEGARERCGEVPDCYAREGGRVVYAREAPGPLLYWNVDPSWTDPTGKGRKKWVEKGKKTTYQISEPGSRAKGKAEREAAPPPAPKPGSPKRGKPAGAEAVRALAGELQALNPASLDPAAREALAGRLLALTAADMQAVGSALGLKLRGNKSPMAQKLIEWAGQQPPPTPAPAPTPEAPDPAPPERPAAPASDPYTAALSGGDRQAALDHLDDAGKADLLKLAQQHGLKASARTPAKTLREDLARALDARTAGKGAEAPPAPAPLAEPAASAPDEPKVWESFRRAEQAERKRGAANETSNVKVPELFDHVRAEHPGLTTEQFHSLLQKWQDEDRLTLQAVNDPSAEPRAGEMLRIPVDDRTGRGGTMGYVDLRDEHALKGEAPPASTPAHNPARDQQALQKALDAHHAQRPGEPASFAALAQAAGITEPARLHAAVAALQKQGVATASGVEGRHGTDPEEARWHAPDPTSADGSTRLGFLSRREGAPAAAPAASPAPKAPPAPAAPKAPPAPAPPKAPAAPPKPSKPPAQMDTAEAAEWANQSSPGQRGGPSGPLRTALSAVYDDLQLLREYRADGLVDLPRLYQEARKRVPDLTPEEFKAEVKAWWEQHQGAGHEGRAEMHVHNEQHNLTDEQRALQITGSDGAPRYYLYLPRDWRR